MDNLLNKKCIPCSTYIDPLKGEKIHKFLNQIDGWIVINEHHLEKEYKLPDFKTGLDFVNKVGNIAEQEDHHPDIYLAWGKVKIIIYTHKIDGLSENDFILAAKIGKI